MSDTSDENKKKLPGWAATIAEEAVAAAPGATLGIVTSNPIVGAVGVALGVGIKGMIAAVRGAAVARSQARAARFEHEVAVQLESGGPDAVDRLQNDERFSEVIFQNYRRAMDALDPSVIPALGKLTLAYRDRAPDGFFKSLGQVLQELAGDEFAAFQRVMSAVSNAAARFGGVATVEVTPWRGVAGRQELHFTHPDDRKAAFACAAPADAARILDLIQRNGLAPGFQDTGADLALTNRRELPVESCERVLSVIGRGHVELAIAVYDHDAGQRRHDAEP